MKQLRTHGRLAARAIGRIERYRQSDLATRAACRFTPTCSHYAEEALRTRRLPAAVLLIVWRLLRCNPFMHRRVADPVRRTRRWRPRPNTLPTFFSVLALSGFVLVVTAGIAQAVGVNNGCTASINGKDPANLDSDHPLVVHRHEVVRFIGTVPPSVQGVPKDQLTSNTHIKVDFVEGVPLFGVSSTDHPGHGPFWGGDQNVDNYLTYAVGLYHVSGTAIGRPGGWTCDGDAYVRLEDGNPLGKPVGGAAALLTVVGLAGAAYASRATEPDGSIVGGDGGSDDDEPVTPHDDKTHAMAHEMENVIVSPERGANGAAGLACLILIVIAIGATLLSKNNLASAVGAAGLARRGPRRVWSHGHPIVGFFSGLLLGIGTTVLMQQFAVWPLTKLTAFVFPVVVAVICALRAWLGKAYTIEHRSS